MTDRIHSLTVILDKDYREDDIECLVNAIQMMKHVIEVTVHVSDVESRMAEERALEYYRKKLFNVLYPYLKQEEA